MRQGTYEAACAQRVGQRGGARVAARGGEQRELGELRQRARAQAAAQGAAHARRRLNDAWLALDSSLGRA